MIEPRNLICVDVETSGLDPEAGCEVLQLYASAINIADLSRHHAGSFHAIIKPSRPEKAEAGALKVIGPLWAKAQEEGLDAKVVYKKYLEWCHSVNDKGKGYTKPIMIAYNKDFDSKFIRAGCLEHKLVTKSQWGWEFPWGWEFDALGFAWAFLENSPDLNDLKLDSILAKFGLFRKDPNIHSAEEDVELMTQFIVRLLKFCREARKRMRIIPAGDTQ